MKTSNVVSVCSLMVLAVLSGACKKGPVKGAASPTPTAAVSPSPSPSTSPTPTATPEPEPTDCLQSIPTAPVPMVHNGACTQGYVRAVYTTLNNKSYQLCVARSACEHSQHSNFRCLQGDYPEITKDCHPIVENIDYENAYHHWVIDEATGLVDDGVRGEYDALGRQVFNGVVTRDWTWTGSCPPKLCPVKQTTKQCVNPAPPPLHHMQIDAGGKQADGRYRFDATPIVCDGPAGSATANYCSTVWNGTKTGCCPARPDNDPLRETCDYELVGNDTLSGNPGPVWSTTYGGQIYDSGNPFTIEVDWADPNYQVDVYGCGNRIGIHPGVCNGVRLGP